MQALFRFIATALIALSLLPQAAFAQQDRPNILLITADDMNWDSLGCFGCPLEGVSPNLDRLATQGVRFDQAYVNIAICQPCRASIMTARYPHRSGALGFDEINPGVPTLPETLRSAGYYSACIGKAVHTVPSRHATAFDVTYDMADLGYGRSPALYQQAFSGAIDASRESGKPFFINLNTHDPHRPFANSPQEQRDRRPRAWEGVPLVANPYQPDEVPLPGFLPDLPEIRLEMSEYFTSVRRCDEIVGVVLEQLDAAGLADNTVVIFLSDNGIAVPFAKTNCWLNSNRTPLIIRWPGVADAGTVVDQKMVAAIDLAPTILDIVGLENLEGADGQSFRGLIDPDVSSDGVGRDRVFVYLNAPFSHQPFPMRGMIMPTMGYIWNGWADGQREFRNESMSGRTFPAMQRAAADDPAIAARVLSYLYRTPEEFYLYEEDPDALNNLIDSPVHPEIDYVRAQMLEQMERTSDPQLEAYDTFLVEELGWR